MKSDMENKDIFPHLSREELRKMAEELSDPKLEPLPWTYNWKRILADKVDNADELVEAIEREKKVAYQFGWEAGKKAAQIL